MKISIPGWINTVMKNTSRKITTPDQNAGLEKTSLLRRPLNCGDRIIHTATGIRGTCLATELVNGAQTVTMRSYNGRIFRNLSRFEFGLSSESLSAQELPLRSATANPSHDFLDALRSDRIYVEENLTSRIE